MDLSIHTDILIQIKRVYILGGHIDSMQEKITQDGELTIS